MISTYVPYLKKKEKNFINRCLKDNYISTAGNLISIFENEFCKKFKFRYAVALNSGTSALHMGLKTLGVKQNDIVILPSYTFAATANAIIYNNASPWFFDCDKNYDLSLKELEKELSQKTFIKGKNLYLKKNNKIIRAIIPVSTFGKKIDFNKYYQFAKKYKLKVLFDTAACHDYRIFKFKKDPSMHFCFSFNGNKTITTGAGGIFATNSLAASKTVRTYANVGKSEAEKYNHSVVGYNYKMTNIQAAIGIGQIKNLNEILKKKKKIFNIYNKNFKYDIKTFSDKKFVNWLFVLNLKSSLSFKKLKTYFKKSKIQLNYFWRPLHNQKPYKSFMRCDLKNTKNIWNKVAVLPSHPGITPKEQSKIIRIIKNNI